MPNGYGGRIDPERLKIYRDQLRQAMKIADVCNAKDIDFHIEIGGHVFTRSDPHPVYLLSMLFRMVRRFGANFGHPGTAKTINDLLENLICLLNFAPHLANEMIQGYYDHDLAALSKDEVKQLIDSCTYKEWGAKPDEQNPKEDDGPKEPPVPVV